MGALVELLSPGHRRLPRVAVLEVFVENPDSPLSAPEVEDSSGVSRRAAYYIINDLVKEGLLVKIPKKGITQLYALNSNDVRSSPLVYIEKLLTIGRLEAEMKREEGLDQSELLEESILSELRSPPRRSVPTGFIMVHPEFNFAGTLEQPPYRFKAIVPGDQVQVPSLVANPRECPTTMNVPGVSSSWQCG
jgi:hypothetical protein